jgi:hypothetical protein
MIEGITAAVAVLALAISLWQWFSSRRTERVRLLLGEKETVGYEATRVAHRKRLRIPDDEIRALVLAAVFEGSDRARLQVYRALDTLRPKYGNQITSFRAEILQSKRLYGQRLDLNYLDKRLDQLDAALPWIADGQVAGTLRIESSTKRNVMAAGTPPPETSNTGAARWIHGLIAVGMGLGVIVVCFVFAVLRWQTANDVAVVLAAVTGTVGAIVGAYFGVQVGSAGKEQSDAQAIKMRDELTREKDKSQMLAAALPKDDAMGILNQFQDPPIG